MDFKSILAEQNIPTTETELTQKWQETLSENGTPVANNSEYSPFWRVVSALITLPAKWLIDLIIERYYPDIFLKTAQGDALITHAEDRGVVIQKASEAMGSVVFNRIQSHGQLQIAAGEIVQTPSLNGVIYQYELIETLIFENGETIVTGTVKATQSGDAYNLAEGYLTVMSNPVDGVTVTNNENWLTTPGTNDEDPESIRLRAQIAYGSLAKFHIDAVYKSIIAEFANLSPDNIFLEHEAPRGPGTANAWLMLDVGTPSTDFIDSANDYLREQGNHGNGDDIMIYAMPETLHDIVVNVWINNDVSTNQKQAILDGIKLFVRCAFRENSLYSCTKPWPQSTFSFSVLIQEIHNQFGQDFRLAFDNQDISNGLALPKINTFTVVDNAV